jgi:DNA invertase Pin-like site-specific DNA recombinase
MPRGKYKKRSTAIYETPGQGARMLCYIRFSGEDQDSASQEAAMRGWVERNGWIVHPGDWYKDEARSGSSMDGRAAFAAMIRTAERLADDPLKPAGIAVWRFNRFARDYQDAQFYKAHLRRMGYCLQSMADDVPSGDFAPIIESLLDWKAQHDNEQMSQDIKRTFSDLRAQGFEPGGNPPRGLMLQVEPLGVKTNGKPRNGRKWVADAELAPRIAEAFAMRAAGAHYAAIMAGPLQGIYKTASCLPTFFQNGRYVTAGIVPEDVFRQVQAVAVQCGRKEGEGAPGRKGSTHLLSGLVRCGCGSAMVGDSLRGGFRYYRCSRKHRERSQCTCAQGKVQAEQLEGPILDGLISRVLAADRVDYTTTAVNGELNGGDGLELQAEGLRRQIVDVDSAIARLVAAVERGGSLESLLDGLRAKETERRRLRQDLMLLEAAIGSRRATFLDAREVATLLGELRQHREAEDTQELRAVLRMIIDRIVIDGEAVTVHYRPEAEPWFRTP